MGYTTKQAKEFVNAIAPIIRKEALSRGYKYPSAIIAQAVCESAAGTSSLGYKYHNYFGMKCGSKWIGKSVNLSTKEEYSVGTLVVIKDNFRVYNNMEEGVKGYFDFIDRTRYANLKNATSSSDYIKKIKDDGYATSSTYVSSLTDIVKKYGLTKYDKNETICPYTEPAVVIKKGSVGEGAKWVQFMLNKFGYNLVVDGDFGTKSVTALKDFQKKNGLVADAQCGPLTRTKLKQ